MMMIGMPRDRPRSNVDLFDHTVAVVMLLWGREETHLVIGSFV
jgi:hypothetical protein